MYFSYGFRTAHVAVMDMVDAVARSEIAANLDRILPQLAGHAAIEGEAVRGALHDVDQPLPARQGAHDLARSAAERSRGIIGMQGQPHTRLLGHGNHRLEEVRDVGPHLLQRVGAFPLQRRQVFDLVVIEGRHARAGPAGLFVVAFGQPVRIEVVFDDRQTDLAGRADRLDDLVDLLVSSGPSIDGPGGIRRS